MLILAFYPRRAAWKRSSKPSSRAAQHSRRRRPVLTLVREPSSTYWTRNSRVYRSITLFYQARYDYLMNVLRLKQAAGSLQIQDLEEIDQWLKARPDTGGGVRTRSRQLPYPARRCPAHRRSVVRVIASSRSSAPRLRCNNAGPLLATRRSLGRIGEQLAYTASASCDASCTSRQAPSSINMSAIS